EGETLTGATIFHFTDAFDDAFVADFVATIETGDGTTLTSAGNPSNVQITPAPGGGFDVRLTYTYAEELTDQPFLVKVQDLGGAAPLVVGGPIPARAAPLLAGALTVPAAVEGAPLGDVTVFHFTDSNPGGSVADFVATVQTGDGTTLTSLANPGNV